MEMDSTKGSKVKFLGEHGLDYDVPDAIEDGLVKGEIYTVEYMIVGGWSSEVKLEEFDDVYNTVMFENVEDQ